MKREDGQSEASADALASYMLFVDDLSNAQSLVHQCRRELNKAIKSMHKAQMAEHFALQAYESAPWADAS